MSSLLFSCSLQCFLEINLLTIASFYMTKRIHEFYTWQECSDHLCSWIRVLLCVVLLAVFAWDHPAVFWTRVYNTDVFLASRWWRCVCVWMELAKSIFRLIKSSSQKLTPGIPVFCVCVFRPSLQYDHLMSVLPESGWLLGKKTKLLTKKRRDLCLVHSMDWNLVGVQHFLAERLVCWAWNTLSLLN